MSNQSTKDNTFCLEKNVNISKGFISNEYQTYKVFFKLHVYICSFSFQNLF